MIVHKPGDKEAMVLEEVRRRSGAISGKRRLLYSLGIFLVGIVALEMVARLLPSPARPPWIDRRRALDWDYLKRHAVPVSFEDRGSYDPFRPFRADPLLGWTLQPGLELSTVNIRNPNEKQEALRWRFRVSEQGFRSPPFTPRPRAGWWRVVVLGASSGFGFGLNETRSFSDILRRRMRSEGIEILNLSVPGYSSEQGRLFAAEHLKDFGPDLVLFGLGANDDQVALAPDWAILSKSKGWLTTLQKLFQQSALYRMVKDMILRWRLERQEVKEAPPMLRVNPDRHEENLLRVWQMTRKSGAKLALYSLCFGDSIRESQGRVAAELGLPRLDLDAVLNEFAKTVRMRGGKVMAGEPGADSTDPELTIGRWTFPRQEIDAVQRLWGAELEAKPELWAFQADKCHPNGLGQIVAAQEFLPVIRRMKEESSRR